MDEEEVCTRCVGPLAPEASRETEFGLICGECAAEEDRQADPPGTETATSVGGLLAEVLAVGFAEEEMVGRGFRPLDRDRKRELVEELVIAPWKDDE